MKTAGKDEGYSLEQRETQLFGRWVWVKTRSYRSRSFFYKSWEVVSIKLPNGKVTQVNIAKASFWGSTCRELIDQKIGQWLIEARKAPWPSGSPPKFELVPKLKGHFELREIET